MRTHRVPIKTIRHCSARQHQVDHLLRAMPMVADNRVVTVVHLPHDVIDALTQQHRIEEEGYTLIFTDEELFHLIQLIECSLK